jgi:N-acetyl-anhydromuramyl-L-alanine amidase AmpD
MGAHCYGRNYHSIGVCYIGGYDKNGNAADTRTDAQKTALLELLKKLVSEYRPVQIVGHNRFAYKDCPCFDAFKEYNHLCSDI